MAFLFGTRPEITKAFGIARYLAQTQRARVFGICTGQQTDLVKEAISDLGLGEIIPVDWLGDGQLPGQDPAWQSKLETNLPLLVRARDPAAIIGTGDTNSVCFAAMVARQHHIPFIHLEAGIRHLEPREPLEPEELNRRRLSTLVDLHLCPSARQRTNLQSEGIAAAAIQILGDLSCASISEVWRVRRLRLARGSRQHQRWEALRPALLCTCTFHRSTSMSNADHLIAEFGEAVSLFPKVNFVVCSRPDSRWQRFYSSLERAHNVLLLPAPPPSPFQELLSSSDLVVTDSAGVQQEAILLNKPTLALRENIELYEGDPLLHVIRPPFRDLVKRLQAVVLLAHQTRELGIEHVNQAGSLIVERGARMIVNFCDEKPKI